MKPPSRPCGKCFKPHWGDCDTAPPTVEEVREAVEKIPAKKPAKKFTDEGPRIPASKRLPHRPGAMLDPDTLSDIKALAGETYAGLREATDKVTMKYDITEETNPNPKPIREMKNPPPGWPPTDKQEIAQLGLPRKAASKKIVNTPATELILPRRTITIHANEPATADTQTDPTPPSWWRAGESPVYTPHIKKDTVEPQTLQDFLRGLAENDEDIAVLLNDAADELDRMAAEISELRRKLDSKREYLRNKQREHREKKRAAK